MRTRTILSGGLTTLLQFAFDSGRGLMALCPLRLFNRMNSTALATIAATGFTVAFFHAAIPTHWLPFVLVARARRWNRAKTVGVAIFAGLGHVALTTLLGLAIAWFGFQLDEHFEYGDAEYRARAIAAKNRTPPPRATNRRPLA